MVKSLKLGKNKINLVKKPCGKCYGFGLWAIGDPSPVGPMDASDGMLTIECPECHANANPVKRNKIKKVK